MTLTNRHLKEVCLYGCSDIRQTCRYLRNDEIDDSKWYCQKLQPEIKKKIDANVSAAVDSPYYSGSIKIPCGDNCGGYPLLKYISQGFDLD